MRVKIDRLVHLPQAFLATRQLISVGEVIELALQSLKGRRDQVSVVAAQGEQTCIDGNAAALALGELLLNALTAGAPVSLSASLEGRSLVLRVTNPGPGFPPAAIDPFEGAEGKTLGLGLAIAQAVAISHGGALTLTDEGGVSTATLSLVGANA